MNVAKHTAFRPTQKLPGRQLAGETVVVDPRQRKVFMMNEVGGVVWSGVERALSVAEIVAEVVRRFAVDDARATADVARFLDELTTAGLAEPVPAEQTT